ncbi:MAG: DUF4417 domain-containing protein [Clostridia bacterium]|nr:DUF4417 domain-containing protein [Clostridia bacterium]
MKLFKLTLPPLVQPNPERYREQFAQLPLVKCNVFLPTINTNVFEISNRSCNDFLMLQDKNYFYDAFICFYIDDQFFDGQRTSIWTFPWLAIRVIKHFRGIITPDFSTFMDFPEPISVYNTYRMRAFGCWIGREGKEVVNNVRWGLPYTYKYCFDGIPRNSVVAIGTVGGSPKKLEDRERFEEGLFEMVRTIDPHIIIVYGSANYPCFEALREKGIRIIAYQGQTNAAYERRVMK